MLGGDPRHFTLWPQPAQFVLAHLDRARCRPADIVLGYGTIGDEVFVGDWNNNGQDTFAVRRLEPTP